MRKIMRAHNRIIQPSLLSPYVYSAWPTGGQQWTGAECDVGDCRWVVVVFDTEYRHERRDESGRYAGVRRETLLNGVSQKTSPSFITAVLLAQARTN